MAEPNCKSCKHYDAAVRGNGGECRDLTKRIFVRNSAPSQVNPPWIENGENYTCLNHAILKTGKRLVSLRCRLEVEEKKLLMNMLGMASSDSVDLDHVTRTSLRVKIRDGLGAG